MKADLNVKLNHNFYTEFRHETLGAANSNQDECARSPRTLLKAGD